MCCLLWILSTTSVKKFPKGLECSNVLKPLLPKIHLAFLGVLCNALVQPQFDYCSLVWTNCTQDLQNKLQKLQNRAARIITNSSYEIRSSDVLTSLGWKILKRRRFEQIWFSSYLIIWLPASKPISL